MNTCKKLLKEAWKEILEPYTISMSIFRILTFGGYVISAGWIASGANWSFYSILAVTASIFLLIKLPFEIGKTLPKRYNLKLIFLRVWIVLLVGVMAYGSFASITLLFYDGFESLGAHQTNTYHFWKSIGDFYFDFLFPVIGLVSTLQIKYTIKRWKNKYGPAFPSLAWI